MSKIQYGFKHLIIKSSFVSSRLRKAGKLSVLSKHTMVLESSYFHVDET
jgi:hypothetical protein